MKKAKLRELLESRGNRFEPTFWNSKVVDKVYEKALKKEEPKKETKKKTKEVK